MCFGRCKCCKSLVNLEFVDYGTFKDSRRLKNCVRMVCPICNYHNKRIPKEEE